MEQTKPSRFGKKQESARVTLSDEIIGWYGMLGILGAYALVSFGVVEGQSVLYQLLNITGAFGLLWIAWKKRVYQSVALEVVWLVVGAVAVFQIMFGA